MKAKTAVSVLEVSYYYTGLFLIAAAVMLMPGILYATTSIDSSVGNYICVISDNFEGNAGRGIATIGISVIGILALVGRITWTQAIIVGTGCAVLFGAPTIVGNLGGASCDF